MDRYRRPVLVSGPTASAQSCALRSTPDATAPSESTSSRCAPTTSSCRCRALYFPDYYATGHLDVAVAESVIRGIVEGCVQAGAALVGGETAEMPRIYAADDYGHGGILRRHRGEKDRIIDGTETQAGDVVIGLRSSGPHSMGTL